MKPRGRVWRNGVFPSHIGLPDSEHTGLPRWYWVCAYCLEYNLTSYENQSESFGGCALSAAKANDYLRWHTEGSHYSAEPKYLKEIR